jgi:hypothetical protein
MDSKDEFFMNLHNSSIPLSFKSVSKLLDDCLNYLDSIPSDSLGN